MTPRIFAFAVLALVLFLEAGKVWCGDGRRPTEYEVKAAYIYNFAKFVEWPQGVGGEIDVCVLGDDPFGRDLSLIEGKKVINRKIAVRALASYRNASTCDILFISGSEEDDLPQIIKHIMRTPVLTIGDTGGFAEKGVMINFFMENRTVRFEINPKAAGRAGLRISSNLLRIAKIVGEP